MKTFVFLLLCALAAAPSVAQTSSYSANKSSIASTGRWWETAAAVRNVTLRDDTEFPQLLLDPKNAEEQLREFNNKVHRDPGLCSMTRETNGLDYCVTIASTEIRFHRHSNA
jgi:hypothetical protein